MWTPSKVPMVKTVWLELFSFTIKYLVYAKIKKPIDLTQLALVIYLLN